MMIVDDHPMLRAIIRMACEERASLKVVGEASDGEEAVELCRQEKPDVIVLDLGLPRLDGLDVIRRIRGEGHDPRVLVLTGSDDPKHLYDSIRERVAGYLDKGAALEKIGELIEEVARGESLITEQQQQIAISQLGTLIKDLRQGEKITALLTPREIEVLHAIAEGSSTVQMARRFGVSPRTIESHISKLYRKLGANNRLAALSKARSLGLLPDGS